MLDVAKLVRISGFQIFSWEGPLSNVTDVSGEINSLIYCQLCLLWILMSFVLQIKTSGICIAKDVCIFFVTLIINLSFFTNQTVFYAKPQAHVNRAHPLCNLKILSWPQFIFRKACPFLLCICCPFLDVLSCFVTLRGAQYLFGSAACPILYSAKVKQQLWPAKELRISFIFFIFFAGKSESRERGYFSPLLRGKMDLFLGVSK